MQMKKNKSNGRVDADLEPKSLYMKPATKTHVLRFRMLADTLTKQAGWINGDASCRSDELKSPDTQTFLNIYSIIKNSFLSFLVQEDGTLERKLSLDMSDALKDTCGKTVKQRVT